MNIRTKTALIIRKNGEYLVGRDVTDGGLRWSASRWDAWRTRNREKARNVARVTGGIVMLFNPVAGQERML